MGDNIKMDLREIGLEVVDLIQLIQDRLVEVYTAMNFQVT
jgi:hypothetical protein